MKNNQKEYETLQQYVNENNDLIEDYNFIDFAMASFLVLETEEDLSYLDSVVNGIFGHDNTVLRAWMFDHYESEVVMNYSSRNFALWYINDFVTNTIIEFIRDMRLKQNNEYLDESFNRIKKTMALYN
jgi:hypothetical protein